MKYFVAKGETRALDGPTRDRQRGSSVELAHGVTHFELSGPLNGPLVVFVPGLTIPLNFWDTVTGRLHARGLRTLTYSAYGRGYSDRVRDRYEPGLFVDQLDGLLTAGGPPRIHLVGSSMGALIALRFARRAEDRVASLTLSGPAGFATTRNPVSRLPDRGPVAPFVGRHLLRRRLMDHLSHNVQAARDLERLREVVLDSFQFEGTMYALLSTLMHFPLVDQAELFDASAQALPPTLLLWGAEDQVTPAEDFDRAASLLRPVESHLIPDCGHMASFEQPSRFADLVGAFVAAQTGRELAQS